MVHHDSRKYSDAVDQAQAHLEQEIETRSARAADVIQRVVDEVPHDILPDVRKFDFAVDRSGDAPIVRLRDRKKFDRPLHKNALGQVCGIVGLPQKFATELLGHEDKEGSAKLLAHNLNELVRMSPERRVLVRSVKDQVRSVLSDSYLRIAGPMLIETFAETCRNIDARVLDGQIGDLRFSLKAVLGQVRRVGPAGGEEIITYGVCLSNSDHGCGALSVQLFVLRVWCTNTAKTENTLRRVHLGRKLDPELVLQADTLRAESLATCKMLRDGVTSALERKRVDALSNAVDAAMRTSVDPKKTFDDLVKRGLPKGLVDQVKDVFDDEQLGVAALPQQRTAWRLSNAMSWLAQSAPKLTAETRMQLEDEAGAILQRAAG